MRNVRFLTNKAFWRLSLAIGTSRKFESQANCLTRLEVFSCSAIADVTLQLPLHTSHVYHSSDLPIASQSQDPVMRLPWIAHFWDFFTFSHTLPLHNFQLNTGYLIAKLQENLVWNKANKWLNKFNLTYNNIYFSLITFNLKVRIRSRLFWNVS